jgi:PKD repeat protein
MPLSVPTPAGLAPVVVAFTDTSSGATAWAWSFGDGDTSTAQNPVHIYTLSAATAVFLVTLTVTTPKGVLSISDTVTVGSATVAYTQPVPAYVESPGADPQVMLRLSNDGGKTWITEQWRSAGRVGEYLRRVRWNRLGCARRRVFEVSVTDPAPWKVTGAYLGDPIVPGGERG